MKTYPIFQATFSGSDDYMKECRVKVAAVSIAQAVKTFREWDASNRGLCGTVGNLVYRHEKGGMVRPSEITSEHVTRNTDLRATRPDWFSID